MRTTKPKREISHEKLERDGDGKSDRYMKIGTREVVTIKNESGQMAETPIVLIDKIIFPINECPHCGSKATLHRVIQESGDVAGNVLRQAISRGEKGYVWEFESKNG